MRLLKYGSLAVVAYAPITELEPDEYTPIELASLGRAVRKREREFLAGRRLARQLLVRHGVAPGPIPVGDSRLPLWPQGVVASISHTDEMAAVAIALGGSADGIGLDIELQNAATSDIETQVCLPAERQTMAAAGKTLTEYFSAKEAAFKACFPTHREYFNFTDVEVEFDAERYHARAVTPIASARSIGAGSGSISLVEGHVLSLYVIGGLRTNA